MRSFKLSHGSGPMPYPDGSGKMLHDSEVVSGSEWEPYVDLGYIVEVQSSTDDMIEKIRESVHEAAALVRESIPVVEEDPAPVAVIAAIVPVEVPAAPMALPVLPVVEEGTRSVSVSGDSSNDAKQGKRGRGRPPKING